jgi:acetolactate synthase-1/2/3 large subunit
MPQETDIIGISAPVAKWNYQITEASEIPEEIIKSFYIADQDVQARFLIDIEMRNLMSLSSVIKCTEY